MKKFNDLIKEMVQDAEVTLQLCCFVPNNGFGGKGWHCEYDLPQETDLSSAFLLSCLLVSGTIIKGSNT